MEASVLDFSLLVQVDRPFNPPYQRYEALATAAETDLVTALPRHFVAKHASRYPVVVMEPPVPLMSAPVLAVAPAVATRDSGLAWLLGALERAAASAKTRRIKVMS